MDMYGLLHGIGFLFDVIVCDDPKVFCVEAKVPDETQKSIHYKRSNIEICQHK